jgi:hypothetical protein
MSESTPIELSEVEVKRELVPDVRHATPEPPPVRLSAIADVVLPAPAGTEALLDAFYVSLLGFQREASAPEGELRYRAEKHDLIFRIGEPPVEHSDLSPTELEVPSLHTLTQQLIDREIDFERQRGIFGGDDRIVLKDPAGNWIAIGERRIVM